MYGPDDSSAVGARPAFSAAGASGWFDPGDPSVGRLPTLLTPDFLNGLLAEALSVLAAAGITPNKAQLDQLLAAIRILSLASAGGGVYRGVSAWSTSQTLTAAQAAQRLNILSGATIAVPVAGSVPAGTPMDWVGVAPQAVLTVQGADVFNTGRRTGQSFPLGLNGKARFVSDGVGTWWLAEESGGLRTIVTFSLTQTTSTIDFTWPAGAYSEVTFEADNVRNTLAGAGGSTPNTNLYLIAAGQYLQVGFPGGSNPAGSGGNLAADSLMDFYGRGVGVNDDFSKWESTFSTYDATAGRPAVASLGLNGSQVIAGSSRVTGMRLYCNDNTGPGQFTAGNFRFKAKPA